MDSRKIVYRETAIVAIGEAICIAIIVAVYAALGYFQMNVLWGALAGGVLMTGYYFFMAVTVSLAIDRAERGDAKKAKSMVQVSSLVRLLVLAGALVLVVKMGANVLALVLPLACARPIIMLAEFFRKKDD